MRRYRIVVEAGYYQIQRKSFVFSKWADFIKVQPPIDHVQKDEHKEFVKYATIAKDTVASLLVAEKIIANKKQSS